MESLKGLPLIDKIDFREHMFVYAAQKYNKYTPEQIKVFVPEVFIDKSQKDATEIKVLKGNMSLFINEQIPSISGTILSRNYLTMKVIPYRNMGNVNIGDRFLATFFNSNNNYFIISRF